MKAKWVNIVEYTPFTFVTRQKDGNEMASKNNVTTRIVQ